MAWKTFNKKKFEKKKKKAVQLPSDETPRIPWALEATRNHKQNWKGSMLSFTKSNTVKSLYNA